MNPPSPSPPDKAPMMPQGEELKERFDKLTQDYQRIKSQNAILKKAVIQEQQKVGNLEKELRESSQKLRQVTEETDILQFNNERLTKRISVLQDELASKSKEGGWRWGGSARDLTKKTEELDIIRFELEEKIRENAQLHVEKRDLEEDIKQAIQIHGEQANTLKQCVVAKQEELDNAILEARKITQSLEALQEDMDRQNNNFRESEERLGREIQHVIAEINQARKKYKTSIISPTAAPPSPLTVWKDNKHTREMIGTFKDLYYAMESHWDTHMDKITLLQETNPPEQLANIYRELRSTIPSLSTQMTHISESLHQYLPALFSKEALPNLEFADTLHRFVNTCKKWLSYQKNRHVELSQQATGPHQAVHSALAEQHVLVLRALDRLIADREVSAIRSLCSNLSVLSNHSRNLFAQEAEGNGEGGLAKNGGKFDELVSINERLLETQTKTIDLMDKFATKLGEYDSLAGSVLEDSEDSHRLREIASHLIMLYNDINIAIREREVHFGSVQQESDSLRDRIKELENVISRKEDDLVEQEKRMNMTKDHSKVLSQEIETLRTEKYDFERSMAEKQTQLAQEQERALAAQKQQLEASHAQTLSASIERYEAELTALRAQLAEAQRTVDQLRKDLQFQQDRATNAEQLVVSEQQRSASQRQDLESRESSAQELQRTHSNQVQQLKNEVEGNKKQIQDLQGKIVEVEGSSKREMAEKAQQVKVLQQKLMTQEAKLEERTRQVQSMERLVADKEQLLAKLQKNPELVGSTRNELQPLVSLMDSEVPSHTGDTLLEQQDTSELTAQFSSSIIEDSTAPLTPTSAAPLTPTLAAPLTPTQSSNNAKSPKYTMSVVDEAGNQSNGLNMSPLDKEREQALQEHYEAKIHQLSSQMKAADTKAVQLSEQYNSLVKTLESKEIEKGFLLDQIKVSTSAAKEFKEDLESTRTNYDTQLRMLSELALEREDKIQSLEAETGLVKGCKVSCGKCKTWNTIDWLLTDGKGGQRCVKGNHPLTTFML